MGGCIDFTMKYSFSHFLYSVNQPAATAISSRSNGVHLMHHGTRRKARLQVASRYTALQMHIVSWESSSSSMASNGVLNPSIAHTMAGLLERTRSRRTFTKDTFSPGSPSSSTTSIPSSASAPGAPSTPSTGGVSISLFSPFGSTKSSSSKPKLEGECKVAEKGKGESDRRSQDTLLLLEKEREVSETLRTERDSALKGAEDARNALHEAEQNAQVAAEEARLAIEKLEEDLNQVKGVVKELEEKVAKVEVDLGEAEESRQAALVQAESTKHALDQAVQLVDQFRMAADQLA
ncbi:hypothetical protein D9757_010262 [Collybiopsis confluens]|uniref:Uncharacterized protein n=1 Tax=Collybiopsis confluens TaxID=2823264 RepID=A0A8H5HAY7_9AGAR|nr:hypothetical protein D9757_010262 [Collybiopsis confluens]